MIRVLTLNKKSDTIPREDQEKIQRLKREREECLHPVKIRITGHDKNSARGLLTSSGNLLEISTRSGKSGAAAAGGTASDSESDPSDSNSSPYEEEVDAEEEEEYEEYEEEDEISQVASTLNLLKKGAF